MQALWGGRFRQANDAAFQSFNASFSFDQRLLDEELIASQAYARGLQRAGLLTLDEYESLAAGLSTLANQSTKGPITGAYEDVHSYVESELFKICGPVAAKIHTGRSRNEQTATNLRLYVRRAIAQLNMEIAALRSALQTEARQHGTLLIPGYTHLQRAQPLIWGHYLLAYGAQLQRDQQRCQQAIQAAALCPLGSGAIAGNSFHLDRDLIAADLGFAGTTSNSLDATSDRDFVVECIQAAALLMVHLSRMAEDLIIFATEEFGFIELGDAVTTGSSLMPQKKNPDALELIRGKTGRVIGHLTGMLCTLKGLPSGYNKDLQEDKEALFDSIDTAHASVRIMTLVIQTLTPRPSVMANAARTGYLNATELAEYLVRQGIAFRSAHDLVGRIVLYAQTRDLGLAELSLSELQAFAPEIKADIFSCLSAEAAVAAKDVPGGTAPCRLAAALASFSSGD